MDKVNRALSNIILNFFLFIIKKNREEKRSWIFALFMGAMMLFAVRTVMSVCVLEISKEFNYDKNQMVKVIFKIY